MLEKIEAIRHRYKEIEEHLSDPSVLADQKKFMALNRSYKEMKAIVEKGDEYGAMPRAFKRSKGNFGE